jgi:aconitate hydratase
MVTNANLMGARQELATAGGEVAYYRLASLADQGVAGLDRLPMTVKIFLENVLRQCDGQIVKPEDVLKLARWSASAPVAQEIPFLPARVLLQDFTGVPAVVDLAAMRSAVARIGGDPRRINPLVPADLVIDHSVQVDRFATVTAFRYNVAREYERNGERYALLRWAQQAFQGFNVVPPGTGICHQVNLEYLAKVVQTRTDGGGPVAIPDTLVGTDSHTTMINGLGVIGWGVGGIEAEAVLLGQPLEIVTPVVIGFRMTGELVEGATATDLVLTVTEILRKKGVVGKFVEFTGPGLAQLALADRATISNMAPEYGATAALFPVDAETLRYLRLTGRDDSVVDLVERYTKEQGLYHSGGDEPVFSELVELDLSTVQPSLAGPRRPQDRVGLAEVSKSLHEAFPKYFPAASATSGNGKEGTAGPTAVAGQDQSRLATDVPALPKLAEIQIGRERLSLGNGAVVIAAITSCTNTSNPSVMLGAGVLARKAVERGLSVRPSIKTSLAPGSRVVTDYLQRANLLAYLEALGFHMVGYGCTTCIGNSGPLPEPVAQAITENDLAVAAVLSGNRNFEGRIHPQVRAAYLASPPLVVAYALAGTVDVDLTREPLDTDQNGEPVYLRDIWPTQDEIREAMAQAVDADLFRAEYGHVFEGDENWRNLPVPAGDVYAWDPSSTYVQEPPYFVDLKSEPSPPADISGGRVLVTVGDSVTTDHISPAGNIPKDSPAGQYLIAHGVAPAEFNSYGARRGNHEVMVRGTFGNVRLRNELVPGREGDWTAHQPDGEVMRIYDAAMRYQADGVPLLVIAGREYGTGSSRDWAAKGTVLLGIRAVIAESYERIHRSNLVGMGVLPLQFKPGEGRAALGLDGRERYDIAGVAAGLTPGQELTVRATRPDGTALSFQVVARLDTPLEIDYYRQGGILPAVLRQLMR